MFRTFSLIRAQLRWFILILVSRINFSETVHLIFLFLEFLFCLFKIFPLGIAFEQGKVLPTPETVPFRLTRDVVDGMGLSGVEGVFRRFVICVITSTLKKEKLKIVLSAI